MMSDNYYAATGIFLVHEGDGMEGKILLFILNLMNPNHVNYLPSIDER
jgi:hypothetical protein